MNRKRSTSKALSKTECCRYWFRVYVEQYGFYIKRIGKACVHFGHMRRMPNDIPTKLRYLLESNKDKIARLGNAYTTPAAGRTLAHVNFCQTISRQQMRYAYQKYNGNGVYYFDGIEVNSVAMVSWTREQVGISYCIWGAKPESALVFNEESVAGGTPVVRSLVDLAQDVLSVYRNNVRLWSLSQSRVCSLERLVYRKRQAFISFTTRRPED